MLPTIYSPATHTLTKLLTLRQPSSISSSIIGLRFHFMCIMHVMFMSRLWNFDRPNSISLAIRVSKTYIISTIEQSLLNLTQAVS